MRVVGCYDMGLKRRRIDCTKHVTLAADVEVVAVKRLVAGMRKVGFMLIVEDMSAQNGTTIGSERAVPNGTFKWVKFRLFAVFTPCESCCSREVIHLDRWGRG